MEKRDCVNQSYMKKKKKKSKDDERKMDGCRKVKARRTLITDDSVEVREKKEKQTQATTTTVEDQCYKTTKTKRKLFKECNSRKVKKRKTSLDQNENCISERQIQHATSKVKSANKQKNEVMEKVKKQGKRTAQSYPDSDQDYDLIHNLWLPSEELAKRFGLRTGKWTKKEERTLRENMDRYLKEYNIDDPKKILFAYKYANIEEGKTMKELAKSTNFYRKLAKGLKRKLFVIYRKALRLYEEKDHVGQFSESEDKELLRLVAVHGKKWTKIGGLMGRCDHSVECRNSWINDKVNTGPWQESEVKCLKEAVRKLTNTKDGEEVYSGIYWRAVASIVRTRNMFQCRLKWLSDVCWKDCKLCSTVSTWGPENDVELIDKIYKIQVTEECDIDWLSLISDFEIARSPTWLRKKFWEIKRKYCNSIDFEVTEFEDVIDYLYNVVAIDLQNQIFQQQQQNVDFQQV